MMNWGKIFFDQNGVFLWSSITSLLTVLALIANTWLTLHTTKKQNKASQENLNRQLAETKENNERQILASEENLKRQIKSDILLKSQQKWINDTSQGLIDILKSYRFILKADYSSPRGTFSEEKENAYADFIGCVTYLRVLFVEENPDMNNLPKLNIKESLDPKSPHEMYGELHNKYMEAKKSQEQAKLKNYEILEVLGDKDSNDGKAPVIFELLKQLLDNIDEVGKKGDDDKFTYPDNYIVYQEYIDKLTDGISLYISIKQKEIKESIT
ncbi:TPA: hypothetical protein ACI05G_000572 [Streptococcus agalactiae]